MLAPRRLLLLPLLFAPALLLASDPPGAKEQQDRIERGRRIYVAGASPSGGEITAVMSDAGVEVPASAVPCASCHGRDGKGRAEGGVVPTDLTWMNLTKPYGLLHASGRKHPPYDARLLKRAIAMGIDPAGNALHVAMPRFRMSLQDMEDLVAYLQQLGREKDPGVGEASLQVGVLLPPPGPLSGMGGAVRDALVTRLDALNRQGGLYGRRVEARFLETPGPPEQRRAWTADFLERERIFAGLACFLAEADAELAALFEERGVPLIGPFTLHPRESFQSSPSGRYVFYLLSGTEVQGRALVRFASGRWREKPRAAVIAPPGEGFDSAVVAASQAAAAAGWPEPAVARLHPGAELEELRRLAEAKADPVFFLGSGAEAAAALRAFDRLGWHPRFLATAAAADSSLFGAPQAFEGSIFLALPSPPSGLDAAATASHSALAAAEILIETLKRAGRDISREKLVDELERLRSFDSGYAPPVTYGPNRRLGARGAYVVRLDLKARTYAAEGGWVEVE